MPITIDGNGTIGGITAGGLPDGTVDTDMLAASAVTEAKLGSDEQKGLAKAWVNFNGRGTVAIRDSYNVASITDEGTGDFTVTFTTPMASADYCVSGAAADNISNAGYRWLAIGSGYQNNFSQTTSSIRVQATWASASKDDATSFNVIIFGD